MKTINVFALLLLLPFFAVSFSFIFPPALFAQDTSRHFQAALELVKVSGVKEELRGGIKMVRGYGKLPPNDTTVQKFDRSYDALFSDPAVYSELAKAYVSTYDEKTLEGALKWTGSKSFQLTNEKEEMVQQLMSAPADHSPASGVDTAGSHYKTALEVARKEIQAEKSAMNGMPGGAPGKAVEAADTGKEKKLARIYTGMFDEPTLKEKLDWVNSDIYAAYNKKLPSIQMKCVMIVIGKLK